MKDRHFESMFHVISWLGYALTLGLSIYAVKKIYNAVSNEWVFAAILTGIVVNTAEILALYIWNKNKKEAKYLEQKIIKSYVHGDRNWLESLLQDRQRILPIVFFFFFASLSVVGSFVAFHTGYKRGEKISEIQEQIGKQLAMSEGLITQYKDNASEAKDQAQNKRMLSRMYLDKSNDFLSQAEKLLGKNSKDIDYLKDTIENTVALNIYQAYSTLFGGNVLFWAAFFNIFIALLVETAMAFTQTYSYRISNPKVFIDELGEKEPVILRKETAKEPQKSGVPNMQIAHADGVQKSDDVQMNIPQNEVQINGADFAQKDDFCTAKVQTGSDKNPIGYSFALPQKKTANDLRKRKQDKPDLHRKICFEFCQQEAQIKEGLRSVYNYSEIGRMVNTTRQTVDYHLKKENLKS